jgi:hypothetical protein
MPPFRRMKQDVTGKVGDWEPERPNAAAWVPGQPPGQHEVYRAPESQMSDAELNRAKQRGQLGGGGIGDFLSQGMDNPHAHAISKIRPAEVAKPVPASGWQQQPPRGAPSPSTQPRGNPPPTQQLPRQPATTGGGASKHSTEGLDVNLIEIVYRNNAEAQRCYLDFNPY